MNDPYHDPWSCSISQEWPWDCLICAEDAINRGHKPGEFIKPGESLRPMPTEPERPEEEPPY